MCRLFAFSFSNTTEEKKRADYLNSFRELSATGAVLNKTSPGHGDGWGTAIYTEGSVTPTVYKSIKHAMRDDEFHPENLFMNACSQTGIAHLRKMTVGGASLVNTHPFVDGAYSFIHNGTISSNEETYSELATACNGLTDSERLFRKFLTIKANGKDTKDAYKDMIIETKKLYPSYSAINTILHDGEHVYVSRVINTTVESSHYTKDEIESYYTLYLGKTAHGDSFVSSEKIISDDITYTELPNNTFCVIDRITGKEDCVLLD